MSEERICYNIPFEDALKRNGFIVHECQLIESVLGSGLIALGRANVREYKGEYYRAFFELSTGIERMSKLILAAGYALENGGDLPDDCYHKKFGHDLILLFDEVEKALSNNSIKQEPRRPTDKISESIIKNLNDFSDANTGRYSNFSSMADTSNNNYDPIKNWWNTAGYSILSEHYYGKPIEAQANKLARERKRRVGKMDSCVFNNENGELTLGVYNLTILLEKTKAIQESSQAYTLRIIRWLAYSLFNISAATNDISFFGSMCSSYRYIIPTSKQKSSKYSTNIQNKDIPF